MAELNKSAHIKKIKIVVSGGFDPVHIGHVRLFQEAKKLGGELIILVNNDNWLKAKKGYAFMPELERVEIIKAIAGVDRVVLTGHKVNPKDMSVCSDLKKLKPHIFAKGGDRHKENTPEVTACNRMGCQTIFNLGHGGKVQSSSWLVNHCAKKVALNGKVGLLADRKIVIFDLDGTLTASKTNIDQEMIDMLCQLLKKKTVAIIGGGKYEQFQEQLLDHLKYPKELLEKLFPLPTSGSRMYQYKQGKWRLVYKTSLTAQEKKLILDSFKKSFHDVDYIPPKKTYGEIIEDRDSQITFSPLGQKAPLAKKQEWNKTSDIRPKLKTALEKYLSGFTVRLGGATSIDITKKGVDKAYGVRQIKKLLSTPIKKMVYIGDQLQEGGNDFAVVSTGIDTIPVASFEETKDLIRAVVAI